YKKIVVNLTQCPKGTSEFRLFETNETLFNYGVISGGDMVTEAAYCKLKHLFSKFSSVDDTEERMRYIRHYMMVSIQGEMSRSMFVIPVSIENNCKTINKDGGRFDLDETWSANPAVGKVPGKDLSEDEFARLSADKDFIESAVLRFEKVSIINPNQNNKDFHLKLKISIFNYGEEEKEDNGNSITRSIKFSNVIGEEQDVNIDFLEIAKNHLKPKNNVIIAIKTVNDENTAKSLDTVKDYAIQIRSLKILLSATRR
ncbi:MAG: hypothetical protein LBM93_11945, partial [Oscillospiraceae bacterium]|nr:hypothetical protein [Oscillospiraceae bacterium]